MTKLQKKDNEGKLTDVIQSFTDKHAEAILKLKNSKWIEVKEKPEPPKEKRIKKVQKKTSEE